MIMNLQENIKRIHEVMGVILEQEGFPFNKSTYNSDDKSIIGAYMITGETDKMIEVMNIKENGNEDSTFMDNAKPYFISIYKTNLPKSQIEILKPVEGKEKFFYIKLPYWLYKKLSTELEIRRVEGKKRLDINYRQSRDKDFLKKINDPDVVAYISTTNPDKNGIRILQNAAARLNRE